MRARSIQLIAGRTAQEYNRRKDRNGAFWVDRHHATAVETGTHLARCMVYIDMNMVRAGVVKHPVEWPWSGYCEIQSSLKRYSVIDQQSLIELLDISHFEQLQQLYKGWVERSLESPHLERNPTWSDSLAVGSREYIDRIQGALGNSGRYRHTAEENESCVLQEPLTLYK